MIPVQMTQRMTHREINAMYAAVGILKRQFPNAVVVADAEVPAER